MTIPAWIKNNAGWWAEGAIDDNSFVQGIQFLIQRRNYEYFFLMLLTFKLINSFKK